MKLKSTLWALAFACLAVSCSDDLENGPGNGTDESNKQKAYMKVTVNTGVVTRAGENISGIPPTGGEEGDGNETGKVNEYIVSDVTVILFKNVSQGGANETSTNRKFSKNSQIVGTGYAKTSGSMNPGDGSLHNKSVTVLVTATDDEDFDKNTYGVIAVTNWNSNALAEHIKNANIITATNVANLLVDKIHHAGAEGLQRDFIMSSHLKDGDETVTLDANATESNAPTVSVHVERLAAKVRIKPVDNNEAIKNYIYPIKRANDKGEKETIANVRLDQVVLVNKLTSGSYLLKRVTADNTTNNEIPAIAQDTWFGDEHSTSKTVDGQTVYPGINYVIDPWTRNKPVEPSKKATINAAEDDGAPYLLTEGSPSTLNYSNPYTGETFNTLWNNNELTNKIELCANTSSDPTDNSILIDYTMENTTSVASSKNGNSTGALFKATYFPTMWSAVSEDKKEVRPVPVTYEGLEDGNIVPTTKGQDFLVYQGNVYKDFKAIFNEFAWNRQKALGETENNYTYSYDSFDQTNIGKIKISEFENSLFYLNTDSDPMGYIRHLRDIIASRQKQDSYTENTLFGPDDSIDKYLNNDANKEYVYANVKKYEGGVTYYPYWIRHANNGEPTKMGIMEFGIVRNNIYDMVVTDISGLGLSGTDKPEPDKDDETKEFRFNVVIYVKDWVIRNNGGIVL